MKFLRPFEKGPFLREVATPLSAIALTLAGFLSGCSPSSGSSSSGLSGTAPSIVTQPLAASALVGDTASFSVVASGTAPLTYQWLKGMASIPGATSSTYVTPSLTTADDGTLYSVVVTNAVGSTTSASAKLSVSSKPPVIESQPSNLTVTAGYAATFSVSVAGTSPLVYQWLRSGVPIPGATSASYSIGNPQLADSGSTFRVMVSNAAGVVNSLAAILTVTAPVAITITTQPIAATKFAGETATFSIVASGSNPTYQWRRNGANITTATSASYTTPTLASTDDNSQFDVVVSNNVSSVASSAASLRVGPFATSYKTQKGDILSLYAWPGQKNAILTKAANLDPGTMREVMAAADGTWNYYAGAVGKLPNYYFTYNGLATIANTTNLCGDGCTFVGATGMEISDEAWAWLYNNAPNNQWDQVMFYEFGRSFWLFNNQLTYFDSPNYGGCLTTGFAVLMRYRSLQAQNFTGLFVGSAGQYNLYYDDTLTLIDNYSTNSAQNFNNTFLGGTYSGTGGLGCTDLFASLVIRLAQNYGGEAFVQALWKEVLKRPAATSTQSAVDNFVLAASAAANHNLTVLFQTTYKWPVSTSASAEAQSRWGNP